MKKTKFISAFLVVLFLFSGCTSAKEKNETSLTVSQTEVTTSDSVTTSDVTASVLQTTAEASTQLSQSATQTTTVTTTETVTVATTTQAPTSQPVSAVTSTTAVSVTNAESTSNKTETTQKSVWSLFTKPSKSEDTTASTTKASEKNKNTNVCTVTITCTTINQNRSMLKKGKEAFVPKSGIILDNAEVEFKNGETAFDVIKRACSENVCTDNCKYCQKGGIQLEYNYTPAFGTYYIEGIHQLYEKDCGNMSGWMYSVNGEFPTVGSSSYTVKSGDKIVFAYTCDMGDDVGNAY
ncbi:MAG: DUF4430 domain-containing protein [Acutalibacteraceae bacterium]